jgi:hypothetical protein
VTRPALNEISPAKVVRAASLVRTGEVHDLAHVLHEDIPLPRSTLARPTAVAVPAP